MRKFISHLLRTDYIRMDRKDRHKKVRCLVCGKYIRSDNLKRHQRIHKDILTMNEDEVREELTARHAVSLAREEKRQKIKEMARKEGIPLSKDIIDNGDDGDLEEDLLKDNQVYLERIELGKKNAAILDKGVICEELLLNYTRFDIANMELRPRRKEALKMLETPSERKII